jgi:alkylhydroperoxidase/carboxymuconolactone decarboxylase family protein YurZ
MSSADQETAGKAARFGPQIDAAFHEFSRRVFSKGALPSKVKQLIAVAVAHVTQCPYCIRGHTRAALSSARIVFGSHLQNPSSAP